MNFRNADFFILLLVFPVLFSCNKKSVDTEKITNIDRKSEKQTIENKETIPVNKEPGMVWVPGGTFYMGTDEECESMCQIGGLTTDCKIHQVYVDGFWMDEHEVTNAQFEAFIKATGYKTIAEIIPTREEFPDASEDMLIAGSVVFSPPAQVQSLNNFYQWWDYIEGTNWRHPEGPRSTIIGKENYPVVHIAWADAVAYAKWAGKQLPTESEWEFAARGGLSAKKFAWGDEFTPNHKHMANTFQGIFPSNDAGTDGFKGIAPVKQYPANGYGLYDMSGNVWEWCSDWYKNDYFNTLPPNEVSKNPKGPDQSHDPAEPGVAKKVHRGGSFLCSDQYCSRYVMGTRGKGEVKTGTNHLGFRCIKVAAKK